MVSFVKRLLRTSKGLIGTCIVAAFLCAALLAPLIAPHDPLDQALPRRNKAPGWRDSDGTAYYLGTDHVGRDVLSRLIYGTRVSLVVAGITVLVSGIGGTVLGIMAGFLGGLFESVVMRLVDMQLAMPMLLFAVVWVGVFGPSQTSVIIILSLWGWVQFARLARGMTISVKEKEFVEASVAVGAPRIRIILRHIAPNIAGPLIVLGTLRMGQAILLESTLSFLGVGIQPPTPTWGAMLSHGRAYIDTAWWLATYPGLAIMVLVIGVNFLGDTLRDVLDPKGRV